MGRLLKKLQRFFWVFWAPAIFFACTPQAYKRVKPIQLATISTSGDTVAEGSSGTVTVTLSEALTANFSISYETAVGTAGTADFTSTSGTLTWGACLYSELAYANVRQRTATTSHGSLSCA